MITEQKNRPNAREQFRLGAAILGLGALGALGTVGILYESSTWNPEYAPRTQTAPHSTVTNQVSNSPRAYIKTAFNGTKVLVEESPLENKFTFYRDNDGDGWADTRGEGFYDPFGSGLSRQFEEKPITPKTKRMELPYKDTAGVEAQ